MILFDIHTHNKAANPATAILSSCSWLPDRLISTGIHPWEIADNHEEQLAVVNEAAGHRNTIAIGECGLDFLKSTATPEVQEQIFIAQVKLAEEHHKPLIIHCVKAFDRLIALRKIIVPQQPWIIHGFRGKPQQAAQLIKAGFHISLGENFNLESAKSIPADKLFIESDESRLPIADIYTAVAAARDFTLKELAEQIERNMRIFGQF